MPKTASAKPKRQVFSFSCTPELSRRVADACNAQGCTKSWLLSQALEQYLLEIEEDMEDARRAEQALDEFEASGEKLIPAEEVYARAGL